MVSPVTGLENVTSTLKGPSNGPSPILRTVACAGATSASTTSGSAGALSVPSASAAPSGTDTVTVPDRAGATRAFHVRSPFGVRLPRTSSPLTTSMSEASKPVTSSLNVTAIPNGPCTGPLPSRVTVVRGVECEELVPLTWSPTHTVEPTAHPPAWVHAGSGHTMAWALAIPPKIIAPDIQNVVPLMMNARSASAVRSASPSNSIVTLSSAEETPWYTPSSLYVMLPTVNCFCPMLP